MAPEQNQDVVSLPYVGDSTAWTSNNSNWAAEVVQSQTLPSQTTFRPEQSSSQSTASSDHAGDNYFSDSAKDILGGLLLTNLVANFDGVDAQLLNGLNRDEFQQIPPRVLSAIGPEQFGQLSPERIAEMTPQQWAQIADSPALVRALTTPQIGALSQTQIAALRIWNLQPEQLAHFSTTQLGFLSESQRNALSTAQLNAIGRDNIRAFFPDVRDDAARTQISRTPAELRALPAGVIRSFFRPELIDRLLPGQLAAFNREQLQQLLAPAGAIDSQLIARLSAPQLSTIYNTLMPVVPLDQMNRRLIDPGDRRALAGGIEELLSERIRAQQAPANQEQHRPVPARPNPQVNPREQPMLPEPQPRQPGNLNGGIA